MTAKCPECKKEIDHLILKDTRITGFTVEDGIANYDPELLDGPAGFAHKPGDIFYCPECRNKLFTSEGEAVYFFVHSEEEKS